MARLLVRSGANVNATNVYGVPPLSLASMNGNAAVVKALLDAGANANASQPGGETVLMTAARAGSVDSVKALLPRRQSECTGAAGSTALMWAAAEGMRRSCRPSSRAARTSVPASSLDSRRCSSPCARPHRGDAHAHQGRGQRERGAAA